MRIFRPKYKTADGQVKETEKLWVEVRFKGRRYRLPAFEKESATKAFGDKLQELAQVMTSGETPDASLVRWARAQPPSTMKRMQKYGLLTGRFAGAGKPVVQHLAEWQDVMVAEGSTKKHADRYHDDALRIVTMSNAIYSQDLTPSSVSLALQKLRKGTAEKGGLSLQTLNHNLRAIKAFSAWLVADVRATEDLLAHMEGFNVEEDRRHERRAVAAGEVTYLLDCTVRGKKRYRILGPDRAMLYRIAMGTGFRRNELRSLTPESFDLKSEPPTITVAAGYSKRRRQDVQPIRDDLATPLKEWLAGKAAGKPAFPHIPQHTALMIRADLEFAREAWLKEAENNPAELKRRTESDFLLYENASGHVADFHALRHTYITHIVTGGTNVKVAQELARHSTPTLTLKRYTHLGLHDTSKALNALPPLTPTPKAPQQQQQQFRRTGTDDVDPTPISDQTLQGPTLRLTGKDDGDPSPASDADSAVSENLASHLAPKVATHHYTALQLPDTQNEIVKGKTQRKQPDLPKKADSDKVLSPSGEMAERLKAPVSKTDAEKPEPHPNEPLTNESLNRLASTLALSHPDLSRVVRAWDSLAPSMRAGIVAMVDAAGGRS